MGLALVHPVCNSLVADIFTPAKRGRAYGALLTIAALAGMAGSFFTIKMGDLRFGQTQVRPPMHLPSATLLGQSHNAPLLG